MVRVPLELNLQIAKLQLKAQPSTPQEVREQRISAIMAGIEKIKNAVKDCTKVLEELFEVLTAL